MHARAAARGAPSPLELAQARRAAGGAGDGTAAKLVLEAAAPWSPESHQLWPAPKRARAACLVRLGHALSLQPFFAGEEQALRDLWRTSVMPQAMSRQPDVL